MGRSAFFLGQGLMVNPLGLERAGKIHCFDNFLVNSGDQATIDYIEKYLKIKLDFGSSIRFLFDRQTSSVSNLLTVHQYDFQLFKWNRECIEVLVVDVAKNVMLGSAVIRNFFPALIPGSSLVIHQDYHHPWLPHINVVMEYLSKYFSIMAPRINDSIVFKYEREISSIDYENALSYNFKPLEQLDLINAAIERLPFNDRVVVELARIVLLVRNNKLCGSVNAEFLIFKEKYNQNHVGAD